MGNMGLSMANNLVKSGFDVKGYDLSEQTLEKAEKMVRDENLFVFNDFFLSLQGITPAKTIKEVSSDVDYIVSSLPRTADVETVLYQDGGIFENAKKGTCIVDTSTISPIAAKEFSNEA